jgi:probable rRNA maturation factor
MTRRVAKPAAEAARPPARTKAAAKRASVPASPVPLRLSLQLADAGDRALLSRPLVRRWLAAALERAAEITVRVVGEDEGRALNRDYRGKDYATNVLTFDYAAQPTVVADLVLCAPVVRAEAASAVRDLEAHYAHLVVHGALHAQGYDHERAGDAKVMETREREVLAGLGYPDPYSG